MTQRFLKSVKSCTEAPELEVVQTKRPRHLRTIAVPSQMRTYKHRLQEHFTKEIESDDVFDFLTTAVARTIVALARFLGTSSLPVCALIPWLHDEDHVAGQNFVLRTCENQKVIGNGG